MLALDQAYGSVISEKDLRRQIDLSVSRALVDRAYAKLLLADPTVVLGEGGCPPQQYLSLRSIEATTLHDFATQARALFWALDPSEDSDREEALPLSVAVG
ncbi:MAG: hypothetical protein M3069_19695 [Chloroflexota bacterium]|nr:hypothetical protein [Chloroflexota bacterium]